MRRARIRTRLTGYLGGLFLAAGAVLLAVTYVLVRRSLPDPEDGTVVRAESGPVTPSDSRLSVNLTIEQSQELIDKVHHDTLTSLLLYGGLALGLVGLVTIVLVWLLANRILRPLQKVTETARRVADRSLHERIALAGPDDEVKELADTFDSMLERLDRSFDGQRRFVANASHELRTPLAINRTLLELATRRPDAPPQVTDLATTLLAVNAGHERLIDGLLTLAGSEQPVTVRDPVDLAELARRAVSQQPAGAVELRTSFESAPTAGDPVLLARITGNLVENGVAYNTPDGWVAVATGVRDGAALLTVGNTGPEIAAYEVPGLFEPFRRLRDRVTEGGAGLGLSIVRSVARAHGGDVRARPRDGGGLVVTVSLPLEPVE